MPRGDRRGPDGSGPMTGRGMGFCAGNEAPGYMSDGFGGGRGTGFGKGRGAGMGRGYGRTAKGWNCGGGRGGHGARGFRFEQNGYQAYGAVLPQPFSIGEADELRMLKRQAEDMKQYIENVNSRIAELEKDASKQD